MAFSPWNDSTQEPFIKIEGLRKSFGASEAVKDLTLSIYKGEFFALLGPSGCGKTTLLRMLAGFETPTAGRILLNENDVSAMPPNERPFNMMFQSYALFPHLTLADNIAFGLKRAGMPKAQVAERVDQMLTLVQLKGLAKRKPHQISGGQKQRVALARALARQPQLLLLDEPMAALDKKLRQETQLELMAIQEKLGTTFVIVTHDQEEAMTVATRVAVMNGGQVEQVATPMDIYENPNSRFVAGFIGEANIFSGTTRRTGPDTYNVIWSDNHLPLQVRSTVALPDGQACWMAVRPEKILVGKSRRTGDRNVLKGTIDDIIYLGDVSAYRVQIADGKILTAQMTNKSRNRLEHFTYGETVWLSWDDTSAVLMDR